MLLTSNYVYPAEVTGYVRAAMADMAVNRFSLGQFLPNEFVDDIEYRVAAGGTGLADAAAYRSYDAESPIGRRQTLRDIVGELPPMSLKTRSSEYDRLRMRKVTDQRIRDEIFNDARKLTRDILARVELARGQTLVQGKTPVPELGTTIDWQRSAAHTVTAATLWNATSGTPDPLSDLMSWRDTYLATNGVEPGALVLSRKVWNIMLRNQAVRNQVFPGANQPSIVTQNNLNEMLAAQGLPQIYLYQTQVRNNGTAVPVLDPNVVLLLPAPVNATAEDTGVDEDTQLGGVFWGTTAEALDPRFGIDEADLPGLVAGEFTEEDPAGLWTKVASINLPVMANPNLSFAATVAS